MTNVLITGVPGWLGGRFLEILFSRADAYLPSEKWNVRLLVQKDVDAATLTTSQSLKDADIVSGDITDAKSLKGVCANIDIVFHAAGIIHPHRVRDLYSVNTLGTLNMLSESYAAGVSRFIHISSNSAGGMNTVPHKLLKEAEIPRPYMNYGLSKYYAENIVNSFYQDGKMETVILRPCWFYGPNQPQRQSRFFKMIRRGDPLIFGRGLNLRSMSYIDNVCQAMVLAALKKEAAGETYWIADAKPYATLEIYRTIAELLGVKSFRPRFLPGAVSEICLFADKSLQSLGLYQTEIHVAGEMNKNIACSIEKAAKELGYKPLVGLREGMRRSIEWCRRQGVI